MIQQKYLEKNEYLPDEYILEWATKVVEEANARDIPFRLLGRPLLCSKVDRLLDLIEKEPKSFGWKIRAKIGTTKRWYNEVEEVQR